MTEMHFHQAQWTLKTAWVPCKTSPPVKHYTTEIQIPSARLSFTKHGTLKFVGNISPGSSSVQYHATDSVSRTAAAVPPYTVHLSSCPAVLSHHQGQPTTLHEQLHLPGSAPPHTEHMWMQIPQVNFMAGFPLLWTAQPSVRTIHGVSSPQVFPD